MSALAIVKQAKEAGIRLGLNGDNITFKATEKPPPEFLAKLREHTLSIVAILQQEVGAEKQSNASDPAESDGKASEIIQGKPLPKEPSKPSKPSKPRAPENTGPNYGDHWGANLEADEAAKLAEARAEIQADIKRNKPAQKRKPETLTPAAMLCQ